MRPLRILLPPNFLGNHHSIPNGISVWLNCKFLKDETAEDAENAA